MIQLTDTQLTEFFTLVAHFHSFKVQFDNFFESFIASEASYLYILSRQKFIKSAKNGPFCWEIEKIKCDFLSNFQTLCFPLGGV